MLGSERTNAMWNQPRRDLTLQASRKRKLWDGFDAVKPSKAQTTTTSKADKPDSCNRLLAGYLAHEFLSHGTLFGQRWDPAPAEAVPVSAESKRGIQNLFAKAEPTSRAAPPLVKHQSYAEVASLLKTEGAHIQGVVNPTQLARWIQM
ncbi:hypothetical protein HHK36_026921 [Tetracentron sinense]|uniref:Embryo sac development arrest 6 n=1 Tax=Tetracentron sinense TaxID=13715 RepID=A0A834YHS6_TETSI|nr:hypothetical protein HHK36_026921 [Tetracentron sinense]